MQDDEAVVAVVYAGDVARDLQPLRRRHVGRVEQWLVLMDAIGRHGGMPQLRHLGHLILQRSARGRVAVARRRHADGAAGVGDVDALAGHAGWVLDPSADEDGHCVAADGLRTRPTS